MMRTLVPSRSRRSRSTSRMPACTVTSSAVVGSSATSTRRVARHRHRDHHPLPHAAGELVRIVLEPLSRRTGCRPGSSSSTARAERLRAGHALVHLQHLGDLPADGEHGVQRRHRLLEDVGDVLAAHSLAASASRAPTSSAPSSRTEPVTRALRGNRPDEAIAATLLPQPDSPTMARRSRRREVEAHGVDRGHPAVLGAEPDREVAHPSSGSPASRGIASRRRRAPRSATAVARHRRLAFGSRASRRPSPNTLKANAMTMIATPGKDGRPRALADANSAPSPASCPG